MISPQQEASTPPIPDNVTDEDALFTGDILSTGYWGASLAEIRPADTVAVIGAGPTGLCTLMCAGLYGPARVIAIDVSDERLELAKKQGLADVILNPLKQDVVQEVLLKRNGSCVFVYYCFHCFL